MDIIEAYYYTRAPPLIFGNYHRSLLYTKQDIKITHGTIGISMF